MRERRHHQETHAAGARQSGAGRPHARRAPRPAARSDGARRPARRGAEFSQAERRVVRLVLQLELLELGKLRYIVGESYVHQRTLHENVYAAALWYV